VLRVRPSVRTNPGAAAANALDALADVLAQDAHAEAHLVVMQEALAVAEGPRFDDDVDALALAVSRMDTLLCEEPVLAEDDGVGSLDQRHGSTSASLAREGSTSAPATVARLRERAGSWRDSASHAALRQVLRSHAETFVERALRGAVPPLDVERHRDGLVLAASSHAGLFEVFPNPPGRGRTHAWVRDVVSGVALPLLDPLGELEELVGLTPASQPLAVWEMRLALTPRGAWMVRSPLEYPAEAAQLARELQRWRRRGEPRLDLLRLRRARAAWHRAGRRASFAAFLVD